jgi:sorbitol-6-phosphate 2-dehydrogenase
MQKASDLANCTKKEDRMNHNLIPLNSGRSAAAAIAPFIRRCESTESEPRVVVFRTFDDILFQESIADRMMRTGLRHVEIPFSESIDDMYNAIQKEISPSNTPDILCISGLGFFTLGVSKADADVKVECIQKGAFYEATPENLCVRCGRLSGKITVVTGSAQGFGEGIAEEMVEEGSYVVIADLNDTLAKEVASRINRLYGSRIAIPVRVNVADELSVKDMIEQTVLEFGGLDIFISNAGVLKAGGLEEMTLDNFEFVTKVNYTAYFLCTKYASRPMKIQALADSEQWSDIIQINSKSGLEGSNRNFAYAGGKFGGIGLTQSFALELVTDHIKVNSICPGNFYEGPLWSDPEKGLFVQYLKAGKVPGAKTIEDVRDFYLAKSPIRRGCSPKDVSKAILYCVEQQYETGQAIPVTGGQSMLK